ncbi:MAG TPA: hypothetical protein GXX37_15085 [Clostridiaceae bacterium]|nr:hypothetical protein [Clostridiaceae bacterium]
MIRNNKIVKPALFSNKIKMIRIAVFILIILNTMVMFLPLATYSAASDADVEIEVKAGFNGVARLGSYTPYRILLINKGRTVNGEIQIEVKIDSENKAIISKPVSLPEGSIKEIVINAPIFTARKGGKIRFVEKNKSIKEIEYSFTKLIPPNMKTIGILSADNSVYSFLNGTMIPQPINPALAEKIAIARSAGVYPTVEIVKIKDEVFDGSVNRVESVLIPLDGSDFPDDMKVMQSFDILIISNYDTGMLSAQQLKTLEKWVEEGGTLVIGTGINWNKVYSSLPQSLKRFSVKDTAVIKELDNLGKFAGTSFNNDFGLNIITGQIGFEYENQNGKQPDEYPQDKDSEKQSYEAQQPDEKQQVERQISYSPNINEIIIGTENQPLAVKYIHGYGRILFLTFDPGMDPFASWKGKQAFWENLLFHSSINSNNFYERGSGYYYSNYNSAYYSYLTDQVPEDRKPPFLLMFIAVASYIVIVGPLLYVILRKKDRREISWILIPAISLLYTFIIYLAGFKTRYNAPVLNVVSLIEIDMENQKAEITTGMGIFNNKRGNLALSYPEKENIEFDITQLDNRSFVVYSDGREPDGKVVSKIVLSDPIIYELYDVSMWEPKYISASKTEVFADEIISSVSISDGRIKAEINNTTKYDLIDAFMTIGSNFIYIGDIFSGEEKIINVDLNSENVYKTFEEYLDAQYGRTSYPSNIKPPEDFPEKRRKRTAISNLFGAKYLEIKGQAKIGLFALNYQDIGYDIKVNGQEPIQYYTNGIFTILEMNFEKGQIFEIPAGIILPQVSQDNIEQDVARVYDDNSVDVIDKGDIDFIFDIPDGLYTEEFSLKFDTYIPLHIKYTIENMKQRNSNLQAQILQNKYEYYLYNWTLGKWERIQDNHTQTENVKQYIDENNRIKVRVKVIEIAQIEPGNNYNYVETERLAFPELSLKGVVK